jgi:Xaa-Pro aminopeptidase
MPLPELDHKLQRLTAILECLRLDAVLLGRRDHFAWITGGRDNGAAADDPQTGAAMLASRRERVCLVSTTNLARLATETTGLDCRVVAYPADDRLAARKVLQEVLGSQRVAADVDPLELGLPPLPQAVADLDLVLTEGEITRYREGGRRAGAAIQAALRQVRSGMAEHEVAGLIAHEVHRQGLRPLRIWVAVDDRAQRLVCGPPTDTKLARHAVAAVSADYRGLVCSLSRAVHFGPPPAELARRFQSACNLETACILSSRPGRTLAEICGTVARVAAEEGFPRLLADHPLGGVTGYVTCRVPAAPDSAFALAEGMALAWTPGVPGARAGDTWLIGPRQNEPLTQVQGDWPKLVGHFGGQVLPRAGLLVA